MKKNYYRSIKVLLIQISPILIGNFFLLFPVLSSSTNFVFFIIFSNIIAILLFSVHTVKNKLLVFEAKEVFIFKLFTTKKVNILDIESTNIKKSGYSSLFLKNGEKISIPLFDLSKSDFEEVKNYLVNKVHI